MATGSCSSRDHSCYGNHPLKFHDDDEDGDHSHHHCKCLIGEEEGDKRNKRATRHGKKNNMTPKKKNKFLIKEIGLE